MGIAVFPAAGGGVVQKFQEFTSSGNWTAPTGVNAVEVLLVGGGGGSGGVGGGGGTGYATGAGGGGGVRKEWISVTPGTNYTITIGAGGNAGTTGPNAGGSGGTTSFGNLISVGGGGGGAAGNTNVGQGGAGASAPTNGGGGGGASQRNSGTWGTAGGGAGSRAELVYANFSNANIGTKIQPGAGGAYGYSAAPTIHDSAQVDYVIAEIPGQPLWGHGAGGKGTNSIGTTSNFSGYGKGARSVGNSTDANGVAGQSGYLSLQWIQPA